MQAVKRTVLALAVALLVSTSVAAAPVETSELARQMADRQAAAMRRSGPSGSGTGPRDRGVSATDGARWLVWP